MAFRPNDSHVQHPRRCRASTHIRGDVGLEEADVDADFIATALGDISQAQGMTQVARDSGLSRERLYKALSGERSPSFDTILKVVTALGLKLGASVRSEGEVT